MRQRPRGAGRELFAPNSVYAVEREVLSMTVRSRGESLIWGLFVLLLGLVLLIGNLRPEWHIWRNLWKFWPVILIVMGINALMRYFSAHSTLPPEPPR
jgi:hypothetical protein